jgi:hypothetical protein
MEPRLGLAIRYGGHRRARGIRFIAIPAADSREKIRRRVCGMQFAESWRIVFYN